MLDLGALKSLSTEEFEQMQAEGFAVIDVRRNDEWEQYGIIEGSHKITFFDESGSYNIDKFLAAFSKIVTSKEQPFILVCAHARRTKSIGEFMSLKLNYKNIYELEGGINWGWIDKGYQTVNP
ncbi:MAG TPA: rhodanese-like domain-containing protein [Sulfurimonas sp.]|nr:MAG: hypothetical protein SPLUMA2_SPLUMAMAG2_01562 [uncultured Sulfurimonas sp.]HIC13119.1 rhodanese-like domain-containing protein [Sulfurimonas sp.]HIM75770.1 rhodanese-like domain-containing protein [Campylobacterales bacterium]